MGRTPAGQTRERIFQYMRQELMVGEAPTVREVQAAFGFRAVETARLHLERLVSEGRLEKLPGRARGYRLPKRGPLPREVPLLGWVQAGDLTLAMEEPEGFISVQPRSDSETLFALRVQGWSMRDAGIFPGDVLVVRRQNSAVSGDVVVALVGDEATVKSFRRVRGRPVLQPANPDFETIVPDPKELMILGKVLEVRRYLEEQP